MLTSKKGRQTLLGDMSSNMKRMGLAAFAKVLMLGPLLPSEPQ
jgi:hypothetical protein